jgi:thiamine-phosphate pyrophosphorylase
MSEGPARLYLISPVVADDAGAFASALRAACGAGDVAAVLLRLAAADERTLVKRAKALVPAAQDHGAAVLIAVDGASDLDLATVAIRAGADGVHVSGDQRLVRALRERLTAERILGAGGLRSKDDAMSAGEAGADYVMFGEPRPDGTAPPLEAVAERAAWWAEIFQTPCVAVAPSLEAVGPLGATGSEFVALGKAAWTHPDPADAIVAALAALKA